MDDFEQFYRRSYPQLFRALAALTGTREDAADLCQDAYSKAARDWSRVRSLDNPTSWVRRVAVNGAVDLHRRQSRQRLALQRLNPADHPEHLDDLSLEVLDALRSLPLEERQVIVLHHLASLTTSEIGRELDRPEGTVKAQLVRGRKHLAAALRFDVEGSHR